MILRNIIIMAFLTAIIVVAKYALGFIVGIEIVTFLCILYGTLLPMKMWIQIISAFILIIGIIYGFGSWWIIYWFIFPIEAFFSWILRKFLLSHSLIFSIWCALWAFSIMAWYYPYDLMFFGTSYALTNLVSAIIPNLLGAVSNFVIATTLMRPSQKLFANYLKIDEQNYWKKLAIKE